MGGPFKVDEERALGALRLTRGDPYEIGCDPGQRITTRRDEGPQAFAARAPNALNRVIRAHARLGTR